MLLRLVANRRARNLACFHSTVTAATEVRITASVIEKVLV